MAANMIADIVYTADAFKVTGFYFPESKAKAESILLSSNQDTSTVAIKSIEKADLEKKFGVESRSYWYTFELKAADFLKRYLVSDKSLVLKDSFGVNTPVPLGNYQNLVELERRIKAFLAVVNRFVIQGNEMARALAYWLVLNALKEEPDLENPVYIHLLSVVALQLNIEGMDLPGVQSFEYLADVCEKAFASDQTKRYFVLSRIACAYGYDRELVDYLQSANESKPRGGLEVKLPLVVLKLKALLLRSGGGTLEQFSHPNEIGQIFKLGVSNIVEIDYLTAEVGEKLSTVCALFHRVFYIREGIDSLRFNEKEFSTLARKLFISSMGILTEDHLRLYKVEVE